MLTFQLNFVSEVYLMNLLILSQEKYLRMRIHMIFHLITILLINLDILNISTSLMVKNNVK